MERPEIDEGQLGKSQKNGARYARSGSVKKWIDHINVCLSINCAKATFPQKNPSCARGRMANHRLLQCPAGWLLMHSIKRGTFSPLLRLSSIYENGEEVHIVAGTQRCSKRQRNRPKLTCSTVSNTEDYRKHNGCSGGGRDHHHFFFWRIHLFSSNLRNHSVALQLLATADRSN